MSREYPTRTSRVLFVWLFVVVFDDDDDGDGEDRAVEAGGEQARGGVKTPVRFRAS